MNVNFPVIELVDRWAISCVKLSRTGNSSEYEFYDQQLQKLDVASIKKPLDDLVGIHNKIWELEKELKSGKEQNLSLEEIGRRAILIRDFNHKRILLKNQMADVLDKDCVREFKKDHLSQ
jgi:hypothetical protein